MTSEIVEGVSDQVVGNSFSAAETKINILAGFEVVPLAAAIITYVVFKHTGAFAAIGFTASFFKAVNR